MRACNAQYVHTRWITNTSVHAQQIVRIARTLLKDPFLDTYKCKWERW